MGKRINIRENVDITLTPETVTNFTELRESASKTAGLPDKIVTVVEAIHSGLTRNFTFYPSDNLEKSVESWTKPYNKPVIKNHDVYEEPVGRVLSAEFKKSNISPDTYTIELQLEISDAETIKKVLDGRYQTLSIGGSTSSAVCSICAKDLVKEGYCGHMKGRTYEGKRAHWIIGEMDFDEISWVNVPADRNAQVIQKNVAQQKESASAKGGQIVPTENTQTTVEEQADDILSQIDALRTSESTETQTEETTSTENQTEDTQTETTTTTTEGDTQTTEPTVEEKLADALSKIATLEADLKEAQDHVTLVTTERDALTTEVTTLEGKVTSLTDELDVAEGENKSLVKQNVTLASYTHRVLAESVANLKIVLGKTEEGATVETLVEELIKEPARSLKEQVTTLTTEKPAQRVVAHVENPALSLNDSKYDVDGNQTESTTPESKDEVNIEKFAELFGKAFTKNLN